MKTMGREPRGKERGRGGRGEDEGCDKGKGNNGKEDNVNKRQEEGEEGMALR